jgi:hypothetical protein
MTFKDRNGEFPSLTSTYKGLIGAFLILFGFFALFVATGNSNMQVLTNDPLLKYYPAISLFFVGSLCIVDSRK